MQISRIRINGMKEPVGFALPKLRCAWQIEETGAKCLTHLCIEVAADEAFQNIIYRKQGANLDQRGTPLKINLCPCTRYWLRIHAKGDNGEEAISPVTYFETGKMDTLWQGKWLTTEENDTFHPCFQKNFSAGKIRWARLYIAGLGLYSASLNGQKIGNEVLTPYYSDYHTECQYQTYDVTDLLQEENVLQVSLGNGWYKGRFGLGDRKENFGSRFQMVAELHLEDENGQKTIIASDESWTYHGSDTAVSDIYDGETLDHLLWSEKENPEKQVKVTDYNGQLVERYSLPVCEQETMSVKEVLHTPAGETVLDFGQNFSGYPVFYASLPRGTQITLDFGEILQDGNFCNSNYRSAKSQFVYRSDGRSEWVRPQFTFFGFRYVRVSGWPGEVSEKDFLGKALYSTMERTGNIECGLPGVNRLFQNALWGQKSNFIDFPTDCPQRDERLGWTGDAQVFAETASYNMETAAFYAKFLHDLRAEQKKLNGILPGVIPVFDPKGAICSSVWGDLATILPSVLYWHYGDIAALERDYPMMKDWVDAIDRMDEARGRQYLYNFGDQLGDWLALDGRTEQSCAGGTDPYFIGSCYYANSLRLTAKAADALGWDAEAKYYDVHAKKVRAAILAEYFAPSGRLCIDTQTAYIVALAFGIWRDKEVLVRDLRKRFYQDSYRLTGGFVGAPLLCRVLAENGMSEEAWYFLLQKDYPGWMHCVDLGATTIWERWNSVLDDGHLSGTMMNSLNHYAFGAVVEFLYRDAAGLQPLEPGFRRVRIAPQVNAAVGYLNMQYDSPYGTYVSSWKLCEDDSWEVRIQVPFGCTALICLPDDREMEVGCGNFCYNCKTNRSPRAFGRHTPFKVLADNPDALEAIGTVSPRLQRRLSGRDPEFLNETIETLANQPLYMGFTSDVQDRLEQVLKDFYTTPSDMPAKTV